MVTVAWERYPLVAGHEQARRWLQFTANLGRAPNTIDAYGRAVEDHLRFCVAAEEDPITLRADTVAAWLGDLLERPRPDDARRGVGLSNATIQQRVVAARSFYDFLVEDGLRERNPVRRGQSGRRGGNVKRGLVRRVEQAPWIPTEDAWAGVLVAAKAERLRNRLMLALAYDGALRREELVQIAVEDLEPAWSLVHLRAETTKSRRSRDVVFGEATGRLLVAYMAERRSYFGRIDGPLFRSESDRNRGVPLGVPAWSKIVAALGRRAGVRRLSTHTFRHLRLTDLARAGWTVDEVAQYAGHRDVATTMTYIHLSGRDVAARFARTTASLQARRERLLADLVASDERDG